MQYSIAASKYQLAHYKFLNFPVTILLQSVYYLLQFIVVVIVAVVVVVVVWLIVLL